MTPTPLAARVNAPKVLAHPVTAGIDWRAATIADLDAVTTLLQEGDAVDHPEYLQTREEMASDFKASYVNLATDTVVAFVNDTMVAFGSAILGPSQQILVRSIVHGTVHPEHRGRGIGRVLLDWQQQRARQQLASSGSVLEGWIEGFQSEQAAASIHLFERLGFATARHYSQLRRVLSEPIADVGVPAGFALSAPEPGLGDAIRLAKNDAFQDHWGSLPLSEEQWAHFAAKSTGRPDLSIVAVAGDGQTAGFVLVDVNEADWLGQGFSSGYIELVGVPRAFRGRKIAPVMLVRVLCALRDAGLDQAVLDVDSASPTGADELYARLGFTESGRSRALTLTFAA